MPDASSLANNTLHSVESKTGDSATHTAYLIVMILGRRGQNDFALEERNDNLLIVRKAGVGLSRQGCESFMQATTTLLRPALPWKSK